MIYKRGGCDTKGPNGTCSKCSKRGNGRKRGKRGSCGVYWYKFQWKGELVRESTKQGNDKVARQMEAAHRTSLAKGEVGIRDRKPVPTLAQFINGRIEPWAELRSSWLWFRAGIRPLLKYKPIAATKLDEISSATADDYAAHRQSQGLQVSTVNRELRVLRRLLRLAMEWGLVERAPKLAMCGKETYRERVVSDDELARYLHSASPLLADVATVLNDTGLRPDECHRLDWSDVTFTNGRHGKLLVRYGKTDAARRELPLTPTGESLAGSAMGDCWAACRWLDLASTNEDRPHRPQHA
jgi:hypothetical protein